MSIDGLKREQVLELKPGRELDVLAGTEIMGWEYIPASSPSAGLIVQDHFFDSKTGDALFGWSPSTNIAAAWEVEEMIYEKGLAEKYITNLILITGSTGFHLVHAAPEQRCKAALLAVMEG